MPFGISFGSSSKAKDGASDGSISPPTMSRKEQRKQKGNGGMTYLHDITSKDEPSRYRLRNVIDPRSNGQFMDMQAFGGGGGGGHHVSSHSSARATPRAVQPDFVQSKLVRQIESTLNQTVRQALLHWDEHALTLENNYDELLHERNGLHMENRSLQKQVAALQKDVNEKVALLKEFQEGHMKSAGSRRLAPSTSTISDEYEALERQVKNTVFSRLARLNVRHADVKTLLRHQPFGDAVKELIVDQNAVKDAVNLPLGLSEVVPDDEVKGLLNWMTQGVIHAVLHRRVMDMGMPGLHESELSAINKVFELIALSEGGQGVKNAEQWRADTYQRLAYWAENVDDLTKYAESSAAVAEVASLFSTIIDGAEQDLYRILEPLCDESTPEGANFRHQLVAIVDNALQFSILIGSQVSRYKLLKAIQPNGGTDFMGVPEHLEDPSAEANSLFYAVPALVKTSNEEGESYETSELLVQGKIYVLFGVTAPRDLDEEEEEEPEASVPDVPVSTPPEQTKPTREIKLASPVNGEDMVDQSTDSNLDIINREDLSPQRYKSAIEKEQTQPSEEQRRAAQESEQRPEPVESASTVASAASQLSTHDEPNTSMMAFSETATGNPQELIIVPTFKGEEAASPATTTTPGQTPPLTPQPETHGATATTISVDSESDMAALPPPLLQQEQPATEAEAEVETPLEESSPPEASTTTTPTPTTLPPLETAETAPQADENPISQTQSTPPAAAAAAAAGDSNPQPSEPSSSSNPLPAPSLASRFQATEASQTEAPASPSSPALPQAPALPQLLELQGVPPVPADSSRDTSPIQTPATESAPLPVPSAQLETPSPAVEEEAAASASLTPLEVEAEAAAAPPSPPPPSAAQDPVAAAPAEVEAEAEAEAEMEAAASPAPSPPSTSPIATSLPSAPERAHLPSSSNSSSSVTESTPRSVPKLTVSLAGTGVVVEEAAEAEAEVEAASEEKGTAVTVQEAGGVEVVL
ncbi:hypothetical protein Dda_2021 [Drechslerella dactyloides]|uniref:Uncharacterized protein n=1 Tax=Drechslerella dactyloides TaxID=74499 RepID=A0AAD6J6Z2_DREDA|nr:hypothetical protein Dda_2021 [Drechslerella dactyloides]